MLILGWNGEATLQATDDSQGTHGHAAAAALICDGKVIAAIEEERLNRVKHTSCFPTRAIEFCLRRGVQTSRRLTQSQRVSRRSPGIWIWQVRLCCCLHGSTDPRAT